MFLSFGKFIGASGFGFISDKYGRKTSFSIASVTYMIGSILVTVSPTYLVLLLGRLCLGLASSGIFYAAFTLCKLLMKPSSSLLLTQLLYYLLNSNRKHWTQDSIMDEYLIQLFVSVGDVDPCCYSLLCASVAYALFILDSTCLSALPTYLVSILDPKILTTLSKRNNSFTVSLLNLRDGS